MTYNDWAARHPQAAAELAAMTADLTEPEGQPAGNSEAAAQQRIRMSIAKLGGLAWRNNVGATPSSSEHCCPRCGFAFSVSQRPVRYGLANDSVQMNQRIKSADVVGILPRVITPDDVGSTIGQFIAVEAKRPGWNYTGRGREEAQQAFLRLVLSKGGAAQFSTGEVRL